jgi:hypothetical protein
MISKELLIKSINYYFFKSHKILFQSFNLILRTILLYYKLR